MKSFLLCYVLLASSFLGADNCAKSKWNEYTQEEVDRLNKLGEEILDGIIQQPQKLIRKGSKPRTGDYYEYITANGGARLKNQNQFIAFLEPYKLRWKSPKDHPPVDDFMLMIASEYYRENLTCEIQYKERVIAEIIQESDKFELEIFPSINAVCWTVPLTTFQEVLKIAKLELMGASDRKSCKLISEPWTVEDILKKQNQENEGHVETSPTFPLPLL